MIVVLSSNSLLFILQNMPSSIYLMAQVYDILLSSLHTMASIRSLRWSDLLCATSAMCCLPWSSVIPSSCRARAACLDFFLHLSWSCSSLVNSDFNSLKLYHKSKSACWIIFHALGVVCWLFSKLFFSETSLRNTIRVSNSLDPDQGRLSVGPDLGPNCLQRLSAYDKGHHEQGKS